MIVYPQRPNNALRVLPSGQRQIPRSIQSDPVKARMMNNFLRMHPSMQGKIYMTHQFRGIENEIAGMGFGFKMPKIKNPISSLTKLVSRIVKTPAQIAKDLADQAASALKAAQKLFPPPTEIFKAFDPNNIIQEAGVVVQNVGNVAQETYDNAKEAVMRTAPPFMRPYVGVVVDPVKSILNPVSTIKIITNPAPLIPKGVVLPSVNLLEDVVKPVYNPAMAIVDTVYITPVVQVMDKYVASALPPSIRDKVMTIANFAQRAGRRQFTGDDLKSATFSYIMLMNAPALLSWRLQNEVINRLRKDTVLGPFINDLDRYSGGLLTSGQRLTGAPDEILHEREVNYKQLLIDALKIYLATTSVTSLLTSMGTNAAGEKTGLDQTPLGRDALGVGVAYFSGNLGSGTGPSFTDTVIGQTEAIARRETIKEANNRGIIKDADMANALFNYAKSGGDGAVLMNWMETRSDHEFQKMLEEQALKQTGYPVKYKDMVKIYNFDYARAIADIARETPRVLAEIAKVSENLAKNIMIFGGNVVDELKRTPQNLLEFPGDVARELGKALSATASEIARAPANVAEWFENDGKDSNLLSNIANELSRTPDNLSKIASNIGRETAKGVDNIWEELKRTPGNLEKIAKNIARELGVAWENILRELENFDLTAFLDKYGALLLRLLEGPQTPDSIHYMFSGEDGSQIVTLARKKNPNSNKKMMLGIFAVLAAAGTYVALED